MKKEIKKIIFLGTAVLPVFVFAEVTTALPTAPALKDILINFNNTLQPLAMLIIGLGVLFLMWNIADYIMAGSGDPKEAKKAATMISYSIIALFVMISVWGLVNVIQNTLGIYSTSAPTNPTVQPIESL